MATAFATLGAALTAHAQPPNNTCGQSQAAHTIPGGGGTVSGTLVNASNDGSSCAGAGSADVYYYFTPSASGLHRFSTCGSSANTVLSLHTACPAIAGNSIACNNDAPGCGGASQFDAGVTAGTPYVIRVGTLIGAPLSTFSLSVAPNPVRACCQTSGACANTLSLDCPTTGGTVQPAGTTCSPNPCPQPGACCNLVVGGCSVSLPAACAGTHLGPGTTCSPNPCLGRCCIRSCCSITLREDCSGGLWLLQQACEPNPCPVNSNDNCADAHTISPGALPVSILAGNCNATDDIGDWCATAGPANSHHNLWWSITPTVSGNYSFDTCSSAVTDTVLALYTSPDCVSFTPLICLDDEFTPVGWACGSGSHLRSRFFYSLSAGTLYYIHVGSWWSDTPNVGDITLSASSLPSAGACCQSLSGACLVAADDAACPASFNYMGDGTLCTPSACDGAPNDLCTNAEPVCLETLVSGTTINALNEGSASCPPGSTPSPDVWYAYVPAEPGRVSFTVQGSGGFDAIVSIWTGTCPGATEIACADQSGQFAAVGTFDVTPGVRYLIRVSGYNNERGPFQLYLDDFLGTPGCGNIAGSGACCPGDNSCAPTTQAACGGSWTSGGTCTPNPCTQFPGACCTAGACTFTTPANCPGVFQGVAISCSPTPCVGSCCLAGACTPITIDRASCTGTWTNCTQNCGCGTPPANDLCAGASPIVVDQAVTGNTCAATSDWPGCFGTPPPHTVWYSFTPATTGHYLFELCGSTVDPVLVLLAGDCNGSPITCGTSEAAPEAGCSDRTSFMFSVPLSAGVIYYAIVSSQGPDGDPTGPGAFTLVVRSVATGACCHGPSSTCEVKSAAGCGFGAVQPADFQFMGTGTTCSPSNPCLIRGACCTSPTSCELRYQPFCTSPDTYAGSGSTCQPASPCTQLGACCHPDGSCSLRFDSQCTFSLVFMGAGTACSSPPCPPTGACCTRTSTGDCSMITQQACNTTDHGVWFGASTTCAATDCAAMGACCFSNICLPSPPSVCRDVGGLGAFQGFGVPCTPSPCAGACCNGTACTVTTAAACTGVFEGSGIACLSPGNPTTCCPANFNGASGVSVQDIFDFLAAYFSNNPAADFNSSGALSVQDIFDFLAAYFAGCN
ncbi:MAG: hypothetical protein IT438_07970 [Phycisphaerales bacterium]|nr:hypothetical protein [Phycisphaerales bacterium]